MGNIFIRFYIKCSKYSGRPIFITLYFEKILSKSSRFCYFCVSSTWKWEEIYKMYSVVVMTSFFNERIFLIVSVNIWQNIFDKTAAFLRTERCMIEILSKFLCDISARTMGIIIVWPQTFPFKYILNFNRTIVVSWIMAS